MTMVLKTGSTTSSPYIEPPLHSPYLLAHLTLSHLSPSGGHDFMWIKMLYNGLKKPTPTQQTLTLDLKVKEKTGHSQLQTILCLIQQTNKTYSLLKKL